ncbi:MAG TPA: hypothetical protein VHV78_00440 [Gemmatimonadaceae bacterium]|nr:hypothetical protein [Gemmatimonadaceae bacterium]
MPIVAFPVDPRLAATLGDARLQAHHAAQLAVAAGISYLEHQPDDSHTNLEWLPSLGALASHPVPSTQPFRVALQISELSLHVLDNQNVTIAVCPLSGKTVADAAEWLGAQVAARGADAARLTLNKHYTIPPHAVDSGAAFNTADHTAFDQLARWFAGGQELLEQSSAAHHGTAVRCWPHHFDIATLLRTSSGSTIGVGMEPGDIYYNEPYYYVNVNPPPAQPLGVELSGRGEWHTNEWFGAVLRGERLSGDGDAQRAQIQSFIGSATSAYLLAETSASH